MAKMPSFKPKEITKKFEKLGYVKDRQKGNHLILYNLSLKKRIVIPIHVRDMPKGTLLSIIKQAGLSKEEFIKI